MSRSVGGGTIGSGKSTTSRGRKRSSSVSTTNTSSSSSRKAATAAARPPSSKRPRKNSSSSSSSSSTSSSFSASSSYNRGVDLLALEENLSTWCASTGEKHHSVMIGSSSPSSSPNTSPPTSPTSGMASASVDPLMRYLEQCPKTCELEEMEYARGMLSTSGRRMERMVASLTFDLERELEQDLLMGEDHPSVDKEEKWSPTVLLCDPQSMSFEVVRDGVDWWEISMLPAAASSSSSAKEGEVSAVEMNAAENGHNMGASVIGTRVDIEWGDETNPKEWYAGQVVEFFHPQHCILYENGEKEWLVMYRDYDNGVKWRYGKGEEEKPTR